MKETAQFIIDMLEFATYKMKRVRDGQDECSPFQALHPGAGEGYQEEVLEGGFLCPGRCSEELEEIASVMCI